MTVLIHDPHNPVIIMTEAGEQVAMTLNEQSGSSAFARCVQLYLWQPDPMPNTVPPIAKTQPKNDDSENGSIIHPSGGTA